MGSEATVALTIQSLNIPKYVRLLPFMYTMLAVHRCRKILRGRSVEDAVAAWTGSGISIDFVGKVSQIIASELQWDNARFFPSDSCAVIFFLNDDLGSVEGHRLVVRSFVTSTSWDAADDLFFRLSEMTFGEWMASLYELPR